MFLSTPLSLTFFFFLSSSINPTYAHNSESAAASSADLFAVAYPIVAYPLASDKHAVTTYLVACPTGSDTASCQFAQPYTLIQGSKTLHFEFTSPMDDDAVQSFTFDCALHGTTSMGCKATGLNNDFKSAPITTSQAFTYSGQQAASFFQPIKLVTDSRALLTYTPGVETKTSALTTTTSKGREVTSSYPTGTGATRATTVVSTRGVEATISASSTARSSSTGSVSSSGSVSSATSVPLTETIVIQPVEATSSTTAFPVLSTSGASTHIPSTVTTSGAGANGGSFWALFIGAGLTVSIGVL